jgi:hypothetical protein
MKVCAACKLEKPAEDFYKKKSSKDGLNCYCKQCDREKVKEWNAANPEKSREHKRKWDRENMDMKIATSNEWRSNNRERVRELTAARYAKNPEVFRERNRKWKSENPENRTALQSKRRARKKQAVPAWANFDAIALFYEEAQFATEFFGVPFHVDHIIPLKGVFDGMHVVCGLHWEENLQVLSGAENLRKKNVWWPDGPMIN